MGKASLAQLAERWTFNPTAAGSNPAGGLLFYFVLDTHIKKKLIIINYYLLITPEGQVQLLRISTSYGARCAPGLI